MIVHDSKDPLAPLYNKARELAEEVRKFYHMSDEQAKFLPGAFSSLAMWEALRIRLGAKPSAEIMAEEMLGIAEEMKERSLALTGDKRMISVSSPIDCWIVSRRIMMSIRNEYDLIIKYDIFLALSKIVCDKLYDELKECNDD